MFAPIFLGDVQPQFFMRQTLFLIYLLVFYGTNSVFNIFFSFFCTVECCKKSNVDIKILILVAYEFGAYEIIFPWRKKKELLVLY